MPADDRILGTGALARMQNGTLGEARTRAFLANRFWVLERLVDVQGADFLIQINSLITSVLDTRPPRFAIVQAKFVQNKSTGISIPQNYLRKENDSVSKEFFLIVCTGYGDDERMFLLDASQVDEVFETSTDPDNGKVTRTIKASYFLDSSNYEITKARTHALNRIERALYEASYSSNRHWISGLGYGRSTPPSLDDLYRYPVAGYDDLPKMFARWKKKASSAQAELEWITYLLQDGLDATDPSQLEKVTDQLAEFIDGNGNFATSAPDEMSEFYWEAEHQRKLVELLRFEGLEGNWLALVEEGQRLMESLATTPVRKRGTSVTFTIDYDARSLTVKAFDYQIISGPSSINEFYLLDLNNRPGHVSIHMRGDIAYRVPVPATYLSELTDALSKAILPDRLGLPDLDAIDD